MSIDNAMTEEWRRAMDAANYSETWAKGGCPLDQLNHALDKPFGQVALWNRCLVFALWQQGHPIEWRSVLSTSDDWRRDVPIWHSHVIYRVCPKPEDLALPSIDWTHVSPRLKWLAQDATGALMLFEKMPSPHEGGSWGTAEFGWSTYADNFASARRGNGDWRKLLVQRPEGA
ncbi:hypothetical protein [Paraburkholderia unamae]|uniref:Uncharacterized protein n=1 Tax=Paraburkholderia unamae TaxID=219649 RepID=A0ABX5KXF2_9BURK|nr:hypothetical protein [Paraburkholderia unamae]PVX86452.1 hypothetical protein C7402_102288 [Paraburkholderia unamae]